MLLTVSYFYKDYHPHGEIFYWFYRLLRGKFKILSDGRLLYGINMMIGIYQNITYHSAPNSSEGLLADWDIFLATSSYGVSRERSFKVSSWVFFCLELKLKSLFSLHHDIFRDLLREEWLGCTYKKSLTRNSSTLR